MKKQSTPSKILQKEIRQQSESEAAVIIGQAEKEAEHILDQARSEAEKIQSEMLKKAEKQAEFIRKRVLSGVHLEIKKQNLQAREAMLSQLFQLVQEKLERFRKSSKYASVLENMIIEGALALGSEKLELMVGEVEKKLLSKQLRTRIEKHLAKEGQPVQLSLSDQKLGEGGVIILSSDGRARFDNRFSARIRRNQDAMRVLAIKELSK